MYQALIEILGKLPTATVSEYIKHLKTETLNLGANASWCYRFQLVNKDAWFAKLVAGSLQ
jgi:hypothetical protein